MNRLNIRLYTLLIIISLLISCSPLKPEPAADKTNMINGVDISSIIALENAGAKFYEDGNEKDLFDILKNNGVNSVRVRLWNDPTSPSAVNSGGRNSITTALEIARRAKSNGMKVILDFHYSDTWADPGQQKMPYAWEGKSYDEVKNILYQYTKDIVKRFSSEAIFLDYVQIGNEVNNGIVFPHGQIVWNQGEIKKEESFKNFTSLLKEASRALRETSPSTKIILHYATMNQNTYDTVKYAFDNIIDKYSLDYDIIGISYYPWQHGSMNTFRTSVERISAEYQKEIMLMEYSYGFTTEPHVYADNIFTLDSASKGGYPASVNGQKECLKDILEIVKNTKNMTGAVYWEAAWIPVRGVGWGGTGTKASWANQALFDYNGNALPSIKVFKEYF